MLGVVSAKELARVVVYAVDVWLVDIYPSERFIELKFKHIEVNSVLQRTYIVIQADDGVQHHIGKALAVVEEGINEALLHFVGIAHEHGIIKQCVVNLIARTTSKLRGLQEHVPLVQFGEGIVQKAIFFALSQHMVTVSVPFVFTDQLISKARHGILFHVLHRFRQSGAYQRGKLFITNAVHS